MKTKKIYRKLKTILNREFNIDSAKLKLKKVHPSSYSFVHESGAESPYKKYTRIDLGRNKYYASAEGNVPLRSAANILMIELITVF